MVNDYLHRNTINLATAGDFGPVQYRLIYEKLSKKFSHAAVVIGLLPINDFTDNDPSSARWSKENNRYRPYYVKSPSGFDMFYKGNHEEGRTFANYWDSSIFTIGGFLDYTWTGGFWRLLNGSMIPLKHIDISQNISDVGYFEKNQERIDAALFFINKIATEAQKNGANVYLLIIPSYSEVISLRKRTSPWIPWFSSSLGSTNIRVVDLKEHFINFSDEKLRACYHACDGHWSNFGNEQVAKILAQAISKDQSSLANSSN